MSEWKEYRLGEIIDVRDGTHDSPKQSDIGKPLVTSKHIKGGKIDLSSAYLISFDDFDKINKRSKVDKWDVLFSMIGTIGEMVIIKEEPDFAIKNVGLFKAKDQFTSKWIYYYLKSPKAQSEILSSLKGSTQQYISLTDLRNFPITYPPIKEGWDIIQILSSLDDKIELNNKINQDLESLAQTLFKQWFIDFEFPNENGEPYKSSGGEMVESELGEIPKGWEVVRLETHAKISLGGTPSRNNGDYWNGNIPWVNSGAINENYILKPIELITQEGLDNSSTKLIPKHSTLIAITGATLGQVSYSLIDACYNQSVISLTPPDNTKEFIHLLVNTIIPELIKHQTGGAQQHINKGNVETFKVLFPPENILNSFKEILTDLYLKIECYIKENQQLTTLRDTLLPKLISGKLEVSQIQTTS